MTKAQYGRFILLSFVINFTLMMFLWHLTIFQNAVWSAFGALGTALLVKAGQWVMEDPKERRDSRYWRRAYTDLVKQTGRDLNDGLGPDPRKTWATERWHGAPAGQEDIVEAALEAFFPGDSDGHLAWDGSAGSLGLTTYRSEWRSRMRRAIRAAVEMLTTEKPKMEDADG